LAKSPGAVLKQRPGEPNTSGGFCDYASAQKKGKRRKTFSLAENVFARGGTLQRMAMALSDEFKLSLAP
jgi:hypothetical protein